LKENLRSSNGENKQINKHYKRLCFEGPFSHNVSFTIRKKKTHTHKPYILVLAKIKEQTRMLDT
jgi:hypothetical protein